MARSKWNSFRSSGRGLSSERYTPDEILNLAVKVLNGIDLDPCADPKKRVPALNHFTKKDNGLDKPWKGKVFLNPPFSDSGVWLKHLALYYEAERVTAALALIPVLALGNSSAQYILKMHSSALAILSRRISFLDSSYKLLPGQLPYSCALIYLGRETDRFLTLSSEFGVACLVRPSISDRGTLATCSYCGRFFKAIRVTAKYCSQACRVQNFRKKRVQE